MSRYGPRMSRRDGDPDCGLCIAQFHRQWSSLPEIKAHAEDGCPYCANMLEGLLYLEPNLAGRFGEDASFRFRLGHEMTVYSDPNGSLKHTRDADDKMNLQYRWFMADEIQPYEPAAATDSES